MSAFCAGCSFVWTTPLLVRLQKPGAEVFLTHTSASWVVSLIEIGNLISPIPGAFLCDKVGRKPVLLSVAPMYILTWLLVLFTRQVIYLYVMRIIQGSHKFLKAIDFYIMDAFTNFMYKALFISDVWIGHNVFVFTCSNI